jgi:hypothetical protein
VPLAQHSLADRFRRRHGGISRNTIRTHVRGVLEKTGCNRQVDIVALLTAISSMRLTSPI